MSSHRVQPSTRPLEFCPNCASYLTILPRATDPVHGFQNYFTCRACLYICLVSESESCEDESCSDETADDETADGETAGDETTDDEAVDDEAVDDEAVDDESPVDPLKSYIHTAVQEMQDIQDGQVTSLLADTKFPSQALMHPKQDEGVYLSNIPLGRVVQYMITKVLETNSQKRRYQDFVNNPVVRCQLIGPNELIKIGGDPESDPNAGVYLHILLIPGLMYLYTGQDVLVREWAMEVRDAYQSLRNHPDSRVQEVWVQGFQKFRDAAAKRLYSHQDREDISSDPGHSLYFFEEGRLSYGRGGNRKWTIELQQKSFKSAQEFLSSGKQVGFYRTGERGIFSVYYSLYNISLSTVFHLLKGDGDTIPEKSGYVPGKSVFLKPILLTRPTPLRYTQTALLNDPASRLIILADIEPGDGTGQFHRLETNSEVAPSKFNRLVDLMEGIWYEELRSLPRRWFQNK
ncbi:uncharacterized protein N7479_003397 [Penicillium vulpinum]|uniref:uncharacterized protein n=1 Tax=Penicillium vulpinum TaxID=29845 RepID=UPI0025470D3F|nr:uncharacterized protein N7479_003397 [Penicillium vulpinum]KAJ5963521.1 hypothetical protein N7479_003397 [Penicillium vulpinum]